MLMATPQPFHVAVDRPACHYLGTLAGVVAPPVLRPWSLSPTLGVAACCLRERSVAGPDALVDPADQPGCRADAVADGTRRQGGELRPPRQRASGASSPTTPTSMAASREPVFDPKLAYTVSTDTPASFAMSRIPVADQPRSANSEVAASTSARVSAACCWRRADRYGRLALSDAAAVTRPPPCGNRPASTGPGPGGGSRGRSPAPG